jgi:hypothetical protein
MALSHVQKGTHDSYFDPGLRGGQGVGQGLKANG